MQNFENIEELVVHMFENLDGNVPVSAVADKDLAVAIMKELLDYENVLLSFADVNTYDYDKEYIVSLRDEIDTDYWYVSIEQLYDYENNKYLSTDGYVLFYEDVNSKALVDMQKNEFIELSGYDWFTIGEEECETDYIDDDNEILTVNGKRVSVDEYNDFVSKFAPDKVIGINNKSDNGVYSISVKYNLGANEAEKIIQDMEHRMEHINDMLQEMDNFRRLFNW